MDLKHIIFVTIVTCCYLQQYNCQSNYASQANNIEYQGNGLPEQTILDGKVSKEIDLRIHSEYSVLKHQNRKIRYFYGIQINLIHIIK